MSLLSAFRTRPPRPPTSRAAAPAAAMEVGGLQLECAVCSYDLFHRRQLVLLDGSRGAAVGEAGWFYLAMSAVSCDRCGAVQLFDPAARSDPDAPIPARRVGRLRHREEADPADAVDERAAEEAEWPSDEEAGAAPLVDATSGGDPATELPEPVPWPDATPAAAEAGTPDLFAGDGRPAPPAGPDGTAPPAPLWPEPLPPLPPLPALPPPDPGGGPPVPSG